MSTSPHRPAGYQISDEEVARLRSQVPDEPVPMAEGHLACEACGVAVMTTEVAETVGFNTMSAGPAAVDFGRCPACQEAHDKAEEYLAEHPLLARQVGPQIALERLEGVLLGLSILGRSVDVDLGLLVPRMHPATHSLRFAHPGRWSRGVCNRSAWAHLSMSQRANLRAAYAQVLADSVAIRKPPVPIVCPTVACLFCGIPSVTVAAVLVDQKGMDGAEATVWRSIDAPEEALGGPIRPHPVRGHLCPACAEAVEVTGSVGFSSRVRAVAAWVDRTSHQRAVKLRGLATSQPPQVVLPAWRVMPTPRVPNAEPWGHLRLDRL
jgi:hypothetical protein